MAQPTVSTKQCSACKQSKPVGEFYRNKTTKDGFAYQCKYCKDVRPHDPYWLTEKGRAAGRARYIQRTSTPEGKAKLHESNKRYKQSEKGKHVAWARYLMRTYKMTVQVYEQMFQEQGGCCAVCGVKPDTRIRFHVDHDHTSHKIRGILCGKCNQAIGLLKEDPILFDRAKEYLRSTKSEV